MKSLNLDKGFELNELEAFLLLVDKLLDKRLEENPKAGIILAKDKPNETRIKYKDAKKTLNKLSSHFSQKGCLSFGICGSCSYFNTNGYTTKALGRCKLNANKEMSAFDSCAGHSKSGGGFGL